MPYVAPSTVTTLQTYTSAAHNVIVGDIIDHESRINDLFVPPMCRVYRTSTSAAIAVNDPVPFTTEEFDTDGMWEGVTNPSRITAPTAGVYLFTGSIRIDGTSAFSQVNFYAKKNNGTEQYWQNFQTYTGTNYAAAIAFTISLAANDYVQIFSGHGAGGTVTVNGSATSFITNLSATWIGRTS
jgi:hypothetical protein